MSENQTIVRRVIPEELMLSRLDQAEQMRDFFLQMWLQNPLLAKCAGKRPQDVLAPISLQTQTVLDA